MNSKKIDVMDDTKSTKWVRLCDYIEQCTQTNSSLAYGIRDAKGMTITKEIIPTKADLQGTDLSKFLIVKPKEFVYNPRTHGKKIGLGFNNTNNSFIISWNNIAFRVIDSDTLLPEYLYMIICREEWDRNACFRSWGSSTEVFSWSEFVLMEIPLPDIEVQRELVAVYNGLKALVEENETLVPKLSAACHAYIVDCREKYPSVQLGEHIDQSEKRAGSDFSIEDVVGISTDKKFIQTKANLQGVSLSSYKVVGKDEFAYVADTSRRGEKIALALNNEDYPIIISSIYTVFHCSNKQILLPEFLFLLLSRPEFDRYSRFNSWGSARETFDWEEMCRVEIPLPPIEVQKEIVEVFNCAERAKKIAAEARQRLKSICSALVQRAAHS